MPRLVEERGHEGVLPVESWEEQGMGNQPDDGSGVVRWFGQVMRGTGGDRRGLSDAEGGEDHGVDVVGEEVLVDRAVLDELPGDEGADHHVHDIAQRGVVRG